MGATRRGDACLWKGEEGKVDGAFRTRDGAGGEDVGGDFITEFKGGG
jgi:hypothetical protein